MASIPANEIKRRGVASIAEALEGEQEAVISVRGRKAYVVMRVEQYQHLRACELEAALHEVRKDLEAGRVVSTSVADHVADLRHG